MVNGKWMMRDWCQSASVPKCLGKESARLPFDAAPFGRLRVNRAGRAAKKSENCQTKPNLGDYILDSKRHFC
jgi:hypothetical protein